LFLVDLDLCGSEDEIYISGSESIHPECIQENLQLMTENMSLQSVLLLDELVENGILTENETADIRDFKNRKNQNRKLAVTISKRSLEKFSLFLEVLKRPNNYPFIANKLEVSYKARVEERRRKQECIQCYMVRNVDLHDIIDSLCSQFVVDLEFVNEVITCDTSNKAKLRNLWNDLFNKLNTSQDAQKYRQVFKESIRNKYEHVAKRIWVKCQINCRCNLTETKEIFRSENMSWPSDSGTIEERSTTSTVIVPNSHTSTLSVCSSNPFSSDVDNKSLIDKMSRTSKWVKSTQKRNQSDVSDYDSDTTAPKQFKGMQAGTVKPKTLKAKQNNQGVEGNRRHNPTQSEITGGQRMMT
jgi:hypothetical protein